LVSATILLQPYSPEQPLLDHTFEEMRGRTTVGTAITCPQCGIKLKVPQAPGFAEGGDRCAHLCVFMSGNRCFFARGLMCEGGSGCLLADAKAPHRSLPSTRRRLTNYQGRLLSETTSTCSHASKSATTAQSVSCALPASDGPLRPTLTLSSGRQGRGVLIDLGRFSSTGRPSTETSPI
jgi:hypothetical protein